MIKAYYQLTKPRMVYANLLPLLAGFFLASKGRVDWKLLLFSALGLALVIASGCVFNNYFDRDIDAKMDRTKNRGLVTGEVSKNGAIIFGSVLFLLGIITFYFHTNNSALLTALVGWIFYVLLYTPFKHYTVHATLIGAIAGATPPVVGYTAVTNRFDLGAILLFIILILWQMPHFYSIAIYRLKDYTEASIPVLPIKKGIKATKIQMLIYIMGFVIATASLTYFGFTQYLYLIITLLLGLIWLRLAVKGFKATDDQLWARKMFKFSLIVLTCLCFTISVSALLLI